jgi:hypothetical protein
MLHNGEAQEPVRGWRKIVNPPEPRSVQRVIDGTVVELRSQCVEGVTFICGIDDVCDVGEEVGALSPPYPPPTHPHPIPGRALHFKYCVTA